MEKMWWMVTCHVEDMYSHIGIAIQTSKDDGRWKLGFGSVLIQWLVIALPLFNHAICVADDIGFVPSTTKPFSPTLPIPLCTSVSFFHHQSSLCYSLLTFSHYSLLQPLTYTIPFPFPFPLFSLPFCLSPITLSSQSYHIHFFFIQLP